MWQGVLMRAPPLLLLIAWQPWRVTLPASANEPAACSDCCMSLLPHSSSPSRMGDRGGRLHLRALERRSRASSAACWPCTCAASVPGTSPGAPELVALLLPALLL